MSASRATVRRVEALRHKHLVRALYRGAALALSRAERKSESARLARLLAGRAAFRRARTVGLYLPLPHEADTAPVLALCRRLGKRVAVPVVTPETRALAFALLRGRLRKNVYGILEPAAPRAAVAPRELDLLVVPGCAFTRRGERLGSGAGYYDRFLARHPRLPTVALALSPQFAASLPQDVHDRRVKTVLAPDRRR